MCFCFARHLRAHGRTFVGTGGMSQGGHNPFLPTDDIGFGGGGFGGLPPTYAPPPTHVLEDTDEDEQAGSKNTDAKPLLTEEEAGPSKPALAFAAGGATGLASVGAMFAGGTGPTTTSPETTPFASDPNENDPKKRKLKKTSWVFSAAYYQQFFDVDTDDVLRRARHALLTPWHGGFQSVYDDTPDLYGPFWVCATLVFVIAMGGQYASYLSGDAAKRASWNFDARAVAASAFATYGYVFLVPALVYLALRCVANVTPGGDQNLSLIGLVCTYGYGCAAFVPASVASVVPSELFRWVAFVLAAAAGATFLLVNAARPLSKDAKGGVAFQTPFCASVVGGHILFGMVVKLWFFTHF